MNTITSLENLKNNFDLSSSKLSEMFDLLTKIQKIAQHFGVTNSVASQESIQNFLNMSEEKSDKLIKDLKNYVEILADIDQDIIPENQVEIENQCIQKALWKLGLYSNLDFRTYIEKGDVIEMYSYDNVQIYRNFEFLKFCSYSLLDTITREWMELYERPLSVSQKLYGYAQKVLTEAVPVQITEPAHIMRETCLLRGRSFLTTVKWALPIFSQKKQCVAFLTIIKTELVEYAPRDKVFLFT